MNSEEYEAKLILDEMRMKKAYCDNCTRYNADKSYCHLLERQVDKSNKCISHQPIYVHPLNKTKSTHGATSFMRRKTRG